MICALPRLEELSISDNQIPQLCDNLASLKRLQMLNINSNPILRYLNQSERYKHSSTSIFGTFH